MTNLIVDLPQTLAKLEELTFFLNFAKLTFNRHVNAVYWSSSEEHQQARRALLIHDNDLELRIANKQLLFFFSLQKMSRSTEDSISFAKGTADKDPNMLTGKLILRPRLMYKPDGTSIGERAIQVPHIDESKLGNLRKFTFIHGAITRIYAFADRKQIKVKAFTETEGDRTINELLKIVLPKWQLGRSEDHSYTGRPPRDAGKPDLDGVTSKCTSIEIKKGNEVLYEIYA